MLPPTALPEAKLLLSRPSREHTFPLRIVEYTGTPAARALIWKYEVSCPDQRKVIYVTTHDVFRQDAALLAELPLLCAVFLGSAACQLDSDALRRLQTKQRVIVPSGRPLVNVKELRALVEVCAPRDGLQAELAVLDRDEQLQRLQQMLSAHIVPVDVVVDLRVGGGVFLCDNGV